MALASVMHLDSAYVMRRTMEEVLRVMHVALIITIIQTAPIVWTQQRAVGMVSAVLPASAYVILLIMEVLHAITAVSIITIILLVPIVLTQPRAMDMVSAMWRVNAYVILRIVEFLHVIPVALIITITQHVHIA